jgi:hypothetical protein
LSELARDVRLVGMMFADEKPDFTLLAKLSALGFKGAMLDTRDKARGRLIAHLDVGGRLVLSDPTTIGSRGFTQPLIAFDVDAYPAPVLLSNSNPSDANQPMLQCPCVRCWTAAAS